MKKYIIASAVGMVVGTALLPLYYVMVNAVGTHGLYFSDWAFFLGIPMFLIGLLILLGGGSPMRAAGNGPSQTNAPLMYYDAEKPLKDQKVARRNKGRNLSHVGVGFLVAGGTDLLVAVIFAFFIN